MWAQIAEDLEIPWHIAEAMHWELGQEGISRQAGVERRRLQGAKAPAPHGGESEAKLKTLAEQRGLPFLRDLIAGAPSGSNISRSNKP